MTRLNYTFCKSLSSARLKWSEDRWQCLQLSYANSRAVDAQLDKERLLEVLIAEYVDLILAYSENPIEDCLAGDWIELENTGLGWSRWSVPKNADAKKLLSWLYLGNWTMSDSKTSLSTEELTIIQSGRHAEITTLLENCSAKFYLDSFHDDDPWLLFFR